MWRFCFVFRRARGLLQVRGIFFSNGKSEETNKKIMNSLLNLLRGFRTAWWYPRLLPLGRELFDCCSCRLHQIVRTGQSPDPRQKTSCDYCYYIRRKKQCERVVTTTQNFVKREKAPTEEKKTERMREYIVVRVTKTKTFFFRVDSCFVFSFIPTPKNDEKISGDVRCSM